MLFDEYTRSEFARLALDHHRIADVAPAGSVTVLFDDDARGGFARLALDRHWIADAACAGTSLHG